MIEVAIALVFREGCLLIARRPADTHLPGYWEFPGGKLFPGETAEECAEREAWEELGVACRAERVRPPIEWEYPDRSVRLHPVECRYAGGPPRAIHATEWAWVRPEDLGGFTFPPANRALIEDLAAREP